MNSSANPRLSAVIVSWNRRADLEVALRSVRAQEHPALEIIVVDNGSSDGTMEWLRSGAAGPLTLYAAGANLGASTARNIGLRVARGAYVAFLDSDAELLDADGLARLERALEGDPKLGAVGPAIYLDRERKQPWVIGNYHLRGGYVDLARDRIDWRDTHYLSTCCSVWRLDLVKRLGGFDPVFPYGFEDNDLSLRARRAGFGLAVDPSVGVCHHLSPAARIRAERDGWAHFRYDERSRVLVQRKHLGPIGFLREEAWLWTREGRDQRRGIYQMSGLRRGQKLRLFTMTCVGALVAHPRIALWGGRRDHIGRAAFEAGRVEKIGNAECGMRNAE